MSNLNKLLRDIHAHAEYLAIFSGNAARLNEQPKLKSEYVESTMQRLSALGCLYSDLLAVVRAELVAKMAAQANTQSYTDLNGKDIVPPCMDWLEDSWYWECGEDFDEDGREHGENQACSRYCIGVDANGDSISVWLNCDMQEVEV